MKAKKLLCVDGDFFCHRSLHGMRTVNKNITLETVEEMNNYSKVLISSIQSLFNTFINDNHRLIDQIVFVFDNQSWRKSVEPFRPYYLENDTTVEIGYKDNRIKLKSDSDINYDNFSLCKNEFIENLKSINIFPIFRFSGAEGDDQLILLKTRLLKENPDNKMIIFCTDGDLKQLLHNDVKQPDSVILYRNIKSIAAPEGEFVITRELYESLYGNIDENGKEDIMDAFIRSTQNTNENYYKNLLFNINFKDSSGKASFQRKPGNGISIATPTLTLLTKIIIGDKKDNIFPLFRWKTKTGNAVRNVSENMLINAFYEIGYNFNEDSANIIYNDKNYITQLLHILRENTKQNIIDIQLIGKHFVHNRKLLDIRTPTNIPENVINEFNQVFDKNLELGLFDINIDSNILTQLKPDYTDSTNIMSKSLPDIPDELKNFTELL